MSNFKEDLKQSNTLFEVFNTVNKHYQTDVKLGTIAKSILLLNIDKLISASGVKPKK